MNDIFVFDRLFYEKGYEAVCGTDEAGAGPLAGPVYAAAVILKKDAVIEGINDSKKLSEKKREELFERIIENCVSYSIASVSEKVIDEINILQARMLAMREAVAGLSVTPDILLVDGNADPKAGPETLCIVGGDGKSAAIAAASILAKVSRDRFMYGQDRLYPQYGFARHKGYGTKVHRDAILQYGPCEIHRRSFLGKILGEKK